ncbi:MAG: GNAT family N-acetyltransferase [Pseudomonadota bacterium]
MIDATFFVRMGRAEDLPALDAVMARSFPRLLAPDYAPSTLVTAVPLIARAQPALVESGSYYVAEGTDGTILGAGGWTPQNPRGGRQQVQVGHIRHFATDPDHIRQGVGRALMARTFADAGACKIAELICLATRTAVPFYRAQGFEEVGPVEIELRAGISLPAIRMRRGLP